MYLCILATSNWNVKFEEKKKNFICNKENLQNICTLKLQNILKDTINDLNK